MKKLDIKQVLTDGVGIGLKNFVSLIAVVVLYALTCWIPYLNVGTTIAVLSIPVELSKGHVINPLFIFDGKYRKNMGEFFILVGLMGMALGPAFAMLLIPGIVLSYAWSLAIYLFLDKGVSSIDALRLSNELTYGNKWRIFAIEAIIGVAVSVVMGIISGLFDSLLGWGGFAGFLILVVILLIMPITLGCDAVIYKQLAYPEDEVKVEADKAEVKEEVAE